MTRLNVEAVLIACLLMSARSSRRSRRTRIPNARRRASRPQSFCPLLP